MFWFGGERLNWYVKKGWVLPLDEVWQEDRKIFASGSPPRPRQVAPVQ